MKKYQIYRLTKPAHEMTKEEVFALARKHKNEKPTPDELVEEYIYNTKKMVEHREDVDENEPYPRPWQQSGPPWLSRLVLDEKFIRWYAKYLGMYNNRLFTDPEYASKTRYRCLIAPSPVFALHWYPGSHGFLMGGYAGGPYGNIWYPLANFLSGCGWEFYDVVKVGTRFKHEAKYSEFFEKKGSKGRLLFLINEAFLWNLHGDLLAKGYSQTIEIPMEARWDTEHIGSQMVYDRVPTKYSKDDIKKIVDCLENEQIRGAEPRYWEDVEVGDKLPPVVYAPWNTQDHGTAMRMMHFQTYRGAFETVYRTRDEHGIVGVYEHPVVRWPYHMAAEHEDNVICKYRGMALPFDMGVQRLQVPCRLLYNWMGDDGFLRTQYSACRKVVYWGDVTWYSGEVVKKYKVKEEGEAGPGGVPGEAEYCAVGIKINGINQIGEESTPGTARIYLPSRELGPVTLPIPHPPRPPYVPWMTHRRDWY